MEKILNKFNKLLRSYIKYYDTFHSDPNNKIYFQYANDHEFVLPNKSIGSSKTSHSYKILNDYYIPNIIISKYIPKTNNFFATYDIIKYIPSSYVRLNILLVSTGAYSGSLNILENISFYRRYINDNFTLIFYDLYDKTAEDNISHELFTNHINHYTYHHYKQDTIKVDDDYKGNYDIINTIGLTSTFKFDSNQFNNFYNCMVLSLNCLNNDGIFTFRMNKFNEDILILLCFLSIYFRKIHFITNSTNNNVYLIFNVLCDGFNKYKYKYDKMLFNNFGYIRKLIKFNKFTKFINNIYNIYKNTCDTYIHFLKKSQKYKLFNRTKLLNRINEQVLLSLQWMIKRNLQINYKSLISDMNNVVGIVEVMYKLNNDVDIEINPMLIYNKYLLIKNNMDNKSKHFYNTYIKDHQEKHNDPDGYFVKHHISKPPKRLNSAIILYKPQLSEYYYEMYDDELSSYYTDKAYNYGWYMVINQCCNDLAYIIGLIQ